MGFVSCQYWPIPDPNVYFKVEVNDHHEITFSEWLSLCVVLKPTSIMKLELFCCLQEQGYLTVPRGE